MHNVDESLQDQKKEETLNTELKDEKDVETTACDEVCQDCDNCNEEEKQKSNEQEDKQQLDQLKFENKKLTNELEEFKDKFLRVSAEYDNYRRRTAKEKEGIYASAVEDVLKEMLPVLDNLYRALEAEGSDEDLRKGVEMTLKQFHTSFEKLGVEEIDANGDFDPNFHNAVMHIEDENLGENQIAEVFLKGYKKGDKVIRYSMVKVAN